jgi:hypothetical protein
MFVDEAVSIARDELKLRGIDGAEHPLARGAANAIHARLEAQANVASQPANPVWLAVCFVLADIVAIVTALMYSAAGRKKASLQVWKAFGYGWLARIVVIVLILIPWGM